jgi:hypothetical protein
MKDDRDGFYAAFAAHEASCRFARDQLDIVLADPPSRLMASPMAMLRLEKLRAQAASGQAICAIIPSIPLPPKLKWD